MSAPALEAERSCRRCEAITRREAANFYYGIRLLPRDKRWAMSAVYAFARRVDDIGDDGARPAAEQRAALAAQRTMVAGLRGAGGAGGTGGAGRADEASEVAEIGSASTNGHEDPVPIALAWATRGFALPVDALELLVEGVEWDVAGRRYATFEELVGYCRRVAGAIGRLCAAIFLEGRVSPEADALADDLGVALQITNILRDVREDRAMGRVYLPAEDLERFGCEAIGTPEVDPPGAAQLIAFEAGRAACWFDRGLGLLTHLDPRSAACLRAMTGIYRALLQRIAADPGAVLRGRVALSAPEKAWVAARALAVSAAGAGPRRERARR